MSFGIAIPYKAQLRKTDLQTCDVALDQKALVHLIHVTQCSSPTILEDHVGFDPFPIWKINGKSTENPWNINICHPIAPLHLAESVVGTQPGAGDLQSPWRWNVEGSQPWGKSGNICFFKGLECFLTAFSA